MYVHTYVLCKPAGNWDIFVYVDILLLVSEFVVVATLSEWWLLYLSGGQYLPLPTTVDTSLYTPVANSLLKFA